MMKQWMKWFAIAGFAALLKQDIEKWAMVVKDSGAKINGSRAGTRDPASI